MQVKSAEDGSLTNHEVLDLIQERQQKRLASKQNTGIQAAYQNSQIESQHRIFVEQRTSSYIARSKVSKLSTAQLRSCLSQIKALNYGLSESEIIQIANHLPEADVEYYLIIENNRLNEEQIESIKSVIATFSPTWQCGINGQ